MAGYPQAKGADLETLVAATCVIVDDLIARVDMFRQELSSDPKFTTTQVNTVTGYEGICVYLMTSSNAICVCIRGPLELAHRVRDLSKYTRYVRTLVFDKVETGELLMVNVG